MQPGNLVVETGRKYEGNWHLRKVALSNPSTKRGLFNDRGDLSFNAILNSTNGIFASMFNLIIINFLDNSRSRQTNLSLDIYITLNISSD